MIHHSYLLLLGCLLTAAQAPTPPVFVVSSATRTPLKGRLQAIETNWSIRLDDGKAQLIAGKDLISLRRDQERLPAPPTGPQVIFANGDRLPGKALRLADERLLVATPLAAVDVALPVSALSVVWVADPLDVERPDQLRRRLASERRTRDLVWLRSGDQLQGNLVGMDENALRIEVERKEVKVERDQVAVIAFNNELARLLRPSETYGHLLLADGTRLGVLTAQADAQTLTVKTAFGATLKVPIEQLRALDLRQGRATYLSDLKPASYEYTPFLPGLTYALATDSSAVGSDLVLAGSHYVKGLGMHVQSRVTYAVKGGYRRFEALVGIDEQAGPKGSARIKVLLDGMPADLGWDKELTTAMGPQPVQVKLDGVQELTLIVEFGRFPFVQGQVNWADARLIK